MKESEEIETIKIYEKFLVYKGDILLQQKNSRKGRVLVYS